MQEVAYAIKKVEEKSQDGQVERWLYVSSVGGIREGAWVPKWSDRKLFTDRSQLSYWTQKMGGRVVVVRKTVVKRLPSNGVARHVRAKAKPPLPNETEKDDTVQVSPTA